jgi:hypothetical protein
VSPSAPAESFKLRLLWDAAFEDFQGLWEPARRLRADPAAAARSDEQTAAIAEAVLRKLLDDGLIYLFRCGNQEELQAAMADHGSRLSRKEAEVELADDWWRLVPVRRADVWIAATNAGERVAFDAGNKPEEA